LWRKAKEERRKKKEGKSQHLVILTGSSLKPYGLQGGAFDDWLLARND
jgi:hypothetical protein